MNKIFKNDNATVASLAAALCFSLIFSSIALAYFSGAMGLNIGIVKIEPLTTLKSYSSEQNYIGGTFDLGTISRTGQTQWNYEEGVGLVLKVMSGDLSTMYINNINPDSNGIVKNYYIINNSVKTSYAIILEGESGYASNYLAVTEDGLYTVPTTILGAANGQLDFFPYANADKLEKVQIITEYKRGLKSCPLFSTCTIVKQPSLKVNFNGVEYTTTNLNIGEDESITARYGGIGGINTQIGQWHLFTSTGLTLESFRTDNIIAGTGVKPDALTQIGSYISAVLAIIGWQVPSNVIPFELQVILIGSQEMALLGCVVVILRGGS